jgi:uracil phosphoribosyltransferase
MRPVALTLVEHPLAEHLLTALRDVSTPPEIFRTIAKRLALALVLEASRRLPTHEIDVQTPLATTRGRVLPRDLVAVPILRAGLGMLEAVTDLFPEVPVAGRHVLVLDPMLATGGSGAAACAAIKDGRPADVRFVCVVAAPEGVARMQAEHPDVDIFAAALDERLDEHGYIVPGLGDFGDRLFGTEG